MPVSTLWLVPNYRILKYIQKHLSDNQVPPLVFTIQDFADEVVRSNDPMAQPLSGIQRTLLVYRIVWRLQQQIMLPYFQGIIVTPGFSETLFSALAEVRSKDSPSYQFPENFPEDRFHPLKEKECRMIFSEYQGLVEELHLFDPSRRIQYAAEWIETGHTLEPFRGIDQVWVYGFNNFSEEQIRFLQSLAAIFDDLRVTSSLKPDSVRQELFSPLQRTHARLAPLKPCGVPDCLKTSQLPAGLTHLQQQLFRPYHQIAKGVQSDGIDLIEAPGMVGETRLVARRIKEWLRGGTQPDEILVVLRDLSPYADLIQEIFGEYHIPVDVEGTVPLSRRGIISTLLRIPRVLEEHFSFRQVSALLRSTYFRPSWEEFKADPQVALRSESLLRTLGEPRGKEAFLSAARRWADNPQPGLEDEQAEESRRQRLHLLAQRCCGFLEKFMQCWDNAPGRATFARHLSWFRKIVKEFGMTSKSALNPEDQKALRRFWDELDLWQFYQQRLGDFGGEINRRQFFHILETVAGQTGVARSPRSSSRVKVLSAPLARGMNFPFVFVMGLGEGNFPNLNSGNIADEMLLFYQMITQASRNLVLSYPAVDDRGQDLLPCSFLGNIKGCFVDGVIQTERRSMLIEGFDRDAPLSPGEYRVQAACNLARDGKPWPLPPDLSFHLTSARDLAAHRFSSADHTVFDGLFSAGQLKSEVAGLFSPERILSPTTLENYVACPFRFLLGHVLKLEPLVDPKEEIESTDRGLAVHRALSRLHQRLRQNNILQPNSQVTDQLYLELEQAVKESNTKASPAARKLWELEGKRLRRAAGRYAHHWEEFLGPWKKRGLVLQPEYFEAGFGLPEPDGEMNADALVIEGEGLQVRISGRIDRVDVVELPTGGKGFWVIDYKTGRSQHYTPKDLTEFRRLQLMLYALAVEKVLLAEEGARPLGLAYWLVADNGPKVVFPGYKKEDAWVENPKAWKRISELLQEFVLELTSRIRDGQFALKPQSDKCNLTCNFSQVCRIGQSRGIVKKKSWSLELPTLENYQAMRH